MNLNFAEKSSSQILVILSIIDTSKILTHGLHFISTKLPKQDIIGWLPMATLSPLFPCQLPTTGTENSKHLLLQPSLPLAVAIWSSLGQLDGRDRWLGDWGDRFSYLGKRQGGMRREPFGFHHSCFLSVWITFENVMPGTLEAFCDKAEKAQITGDIFEPWHQLEWPVFTSHVKWD